MVELPALKTLHLFAGIGGGILADILLGFRCVCAVEIDPWCQKVLIQRQQDGILEPFPIWDKIETFKGKPWKGIVDLVCGGFPCQPFSTAGKRKGKEDERNLWPETLRCISEVGPRFAFLENVPGLLRHDYFGEILGGLSELGYSVRWDVISAASVGAPHLRRRLWILAYSNKVGNGWRSSKSRETQGRRAFCKTQGRGKVLAYSEGRGRNGAEPECSQKKDSDGRRLDRTVEYGPVGIGAGGTTANSGKFRYGIQEEQIQAGWDGFEYESWWKALPRIRRTTDVSTHRMERLKALGNAQVSICSAKAFLHLSQGLL